MKTFPFSRNLALEGQQFPYPLRGEQIPLYILVVRVDSDEPPTIYSPIVSEGSTRSECRTGDVLYEEIQGLSRVYNKLESCPR